MYVSIILPVLISLLMVTVSSPGVRSQGDAAVYRIVPEESVFSVVTHRGGVMSTLAHNHLITASDYEAEFRFDADAYEETRFKLDVPVDSLVIDDGTDRERWAQRIAELGIEDNLGSPSEKDRKKIRKTMLGKNQLDAANYPAFIFELVSLTRVEDPTEPDGFNHASRVDVTIRGVTNQLTFPMNITEGADTLYIEGFAETAFTAFGIKPFSAALGTVKNRDEFHLYLNLTAIRE